MGFADKLAAFFADLSDSSQEGVQKLDPNKEGNPTEEHRLGRRNGADVGRTEVDWTYMTLTNGELLEDLRVAQGEIKRLENELRMLTATVELLLKEPRVRGTKTDCKAKAEAKVASKAAAKAAASSRRDAEVQTDGRHQRRRWYNLAFDYEDYLVHGTLLP